MFEDRWPTVLQESAVTVNQSATTAQATGETGQTCTGELQTWSLTVMADTVSSFAAGPAQACGLAVTSQGGYETDRFDWCRDVDLVNWTIRSTCSWSWGPENRTSDTQILHSRNR